MIDTSQLDSRCIRLAGVLNAPASDEVTLLRTARALKVVHGHLRRATWARTRDEGQTHQTAQAQETLDAMEQDLRRVLIDYSRLAQPQLHMYLTRALDRSRATLEILDS
jgi:hypothetical protein